MKRIKYIILTLGIVLGFGLFAVPAGAAGEVFQPCPTDPAEAAKIAVCAGKSDNLNGFIKTAINVVLYILGSISTLMIIFGGVSYVASAGKEESVKKAKNIILYAVIGVIISLLAYAIVNFVMTTFSA